MRKLSRSTFTLAFTVALFASSAHAQMKKSAAGFMLDTNFSYVSNALSAVETESSSAIYASAFVGAAMDKAWFIGWNTVYTTEASSTSASDQTLANLKMGPSFGLFFNESHSLTVSGTYFVYSTGAYSGTATASWRGAGYQAQLGYTPMVSESLMMGLRLIYEVSTFSTSTTSSIVTTVSYNKTNIFPAFAITLRL